MTEDPQRTHTRLPMSTLHISQKEMKESIRKVGSLDDA